MRRLTASEARITIKVLACSFISCTAVNCEAPAMTSTEKPNTSNRLIPASLPATPNNRPNGTITSTQGRPWRTPRQ